MPKDGGWPWRWGCLRHRERVLGEERVPMAERTRMFTSIRIGNVEVKNRLALAPMGAFGLVDRYG